MTVPITNSMSHIFQHVHFAACIVAKKHACQVLLGAFDGIVSLGHKEPINLTQVWNASEMGPDTVPIPRVSVKFMLHFLGWSSHAVPFKRTQELNR
jgi:hypothetical protein